MPYLVPLNLEEFKKVGNEDDISNAKLLKYQGFFLFSINDAVYTLKK